MRLPLVGWGVLGSAAIVLAGYVLSQGLYVASALEIETVNDRRSVPYYRKTCHYLYLHGTQEFFASSGTDREQVVQAFCARLRNSN